MKIDFNDLFDFSKINDLDKLINKVNRLDKVLNKYSENLSKNIENNEVVLQKWEKQLNQIEISSQGAAQAIMELDKQISGLTRTQLKLVSETEKVEKVRKSNTEEAKKAVQAMSELEKAEKKLAQASGKDAEELAKLRLQIAEVNKATKQQAKEALGLVNTYDRLAMETADAKKAAKDLGATLGTESKEFKIAAQRADELNQKLKDIDAGVGDYQRNVGNYSSAFDGIKQGFSGVLELATPTGLAIAGIGLGIEAIGSLAEVVKETNEQLKITASLTGLSGNALDEYTAKVRTTSRVFDKDYNEVLLASNVLAKEFGISGTEAIDLINEGLVKGNDINGDYLDQIREYSTQFKQAGLNAKELNSVITLGTKEGIFNDKAVDTVKEGGLRLREFTKATSDALLPLGALRNEQIKQAIESGNSFEAIQLVSKGLKDVKLTASQTQGIVTNVFGGAGEDAGLRFIQLLGDIDIKQQAVNKNLTEQQKRQLKVLEVENELSLAQVKLGEAFKGVGSDFSLFLKQLQTLGIQGIIEVVNDFKDAFGGLSEPFQSVSQRFQELLSKFGEGNGVFSKLIKAFNPFTFALKSIGGAIEGLLFIVDGFLTAFNKIADFVKFGIEVLRIKDAVNFLSTAFKDIKEGVVNFIDEVQRLTAPLVELKDTIVLVFSELFGIISRKIDEVILPIKTKFNDVVSSIKNGVLGFVNDVKTFFEPLTSFISSFFTNAKSDVTGFVESSSIITKISGYFDSVISTIKNFISLFTDKLPRTINGTIEVIREFNNIIKENFRKTFSDVGKVIESAFKLDFEALKTNLGNLKSTFSDSGTRLADAFKEGFAKEIAVQKKGVDLKVETKVETKVEDTTKKKDDAFVPTKDTSKEDAAKAKAIEDEKAIDDASKQKELEALEQRNNDLIDEQAYQDELLLIEVRRIEKSIELRKAEGLDTIEQEKALQQILLDEKRKGEQEGLKQQEEANKKSLEIDKKALDAKKKQDDDQEKADKEARTKTANDPINQAIGDAIETRIQNDIVLAGVQAFRRSLEKGDDVQTATLNGTKAIAAAQIFKSLAKKGSGFHDGGYTGDGGEYAIAGVVHKGEFVNTKKQTSKYGMKGWNAKDFDEAVKVGYFSQFANIDDRIQEQSGLSQQIVVQANNEVLVKAINELPSKMPKLDMSWYGKDLQQTKREGSVIKKTVFRSVR